MGLTLVYRMKVVRFAAEYKSLCYGIKRLNTLKTE